MPYATTIDHEIDRRLSRLTAAVRSFVAAEAEVLSPLDVRVNRFANRVHQLSRITQRLADQKRDPHATHLKHRIPSVVKTMTGPDEGMAFLHRAAEAIRRGPEALRRFAERERAAGRLEW